MCSPQDDDDKDDDYDVDFVDLYVNKGRMESKKKEEQMNKMTSDA